MPPLFMITAALGGAAMYFFDPERGRSRRARVRDKAVKTTTDLRHFVEDGKRDLVNRGTAATGRLRSLVSRRRATDPVLVERVRSAMGRHTMHPGMVDVSASSGLVTLSGSILAHEHEELIEAVSTVPGVTDIVDRLSIFEKAEGISELQGAGREHRSREPGAWAPGTRLVTGAAGTTLTLYALARSNRFAGFLTLVTGIAMLARTAKNKPLLSLARDTGSAPTLPELRYQSTRRVSSMTAASTPNTSSAPRRRL